MPTPSPNRIAEQLSHQIQAVQARIQQACDRSGRSSDSVQLIAVTKYTPLEIVRELIKLGQVALGENRPQQLAERAGQLSQHVEWHLIGQLQRNKVRQILPLTHLIHSIDSIRLLRHIDQVSEQLQITPRLLLQVNISGETSKSGFSPEQLLAQWAEIIDCHNVDVAGLMTMAPHTDDEETIRLTFRGLKSLRDQLRQLSGSPDLQELSMGMSGDFEIGIEEGATLIRLGSILFEGLQV